MDFALSPEMETYREQYGEDRAVSRFLEMHPNIEVPLALLRRALLAPG